MIIKWIGCMDDQADDQLTRQMGYWMNNGWMDGWSVYEEQMGGWVVGVYMDAQQLLDR